MEINPRRPNINMVHKREDALTRRLRRFVREAIRERTEQMEYEIPGMDRIFNSELCFIHRLFWCFIIALSTGICAYQAIDRLSAYLSFPRIVDVRLNYKESFEFPKIILCNLDPSSLSYLKERYLKRKSASFSDPCIVHWLDLMGLNFSFRYLWNSTKMNDEIEEATFTYKKKGQNTTSIQLIVEDKLLPTAWCNSYWTNESLPYQGIYSSIRIKLKNKQSEFSCTTGSIIIVIQNPNGSLPRKSFWVLCQQVALRVGIGLRAFKYLNDHIHPCLSSKEFDQCIEKCFSDKYENDERIPCKFPFNSDAVKKPDCGTRHQNNISDIFLTAQNLYVTLGAIEDCGCDRECTRYYYEFSRSLEQVNQKGTFLFFHYDQNYVFEIVERYVYDIISLFCDIGGNLGLYLGLSILSIVNIIYKFVIKSFLKKK